MYGIHKGWVGVGGPSVPVPYRLPRANSERVAYHTRRQSGLLQELAARSATGGRATHVVS